VTIEATLCRIMVSDLFVETPADQIDVNESLRNAYGLDSLGFVELRVQCEDQFNVQISDPEFNPENFQSVRTVADLVRRLQGAQA
jgi:acyl carrier protein